MRGWFLIVFVLSLYATIPAVAQQPRSPGTSETFSGNARAENAAGVAVSAPIVVHVDRYTPDFDRDAVLEALRVGGYPGFIPALRKAPNVGYVQIGSHKFVIRWARETPSDTGRTIVFVTEKPVAFLKAADDTKSRAGYLIGLIRLTVDAHGAGAGTMAAAARVKAGGETGVQVDDFAADTPVVLSGITRK